MLELIFSSLISISLVALLLVFLPKHTSFEQFTNEIIEAIEPTEYEEISYKEPLQNISPYIKNATRVLTYEDEYVQYQKLIDGKWVLHNLNGPAVINMHTNKTAFFIDGINYSDELQYLVAKETYNKKEEIL